jgi:DNA-binding NarL/FixJ family response regulator
MTYRNLTFCEREVADLLLAGYSNADIAVQLGIAKGTAKRHVENIFGKFGIDAKERQLHARVVLAVELTREKLIQMAHPRRDDLRQSHQVK